LGYTKREVVYGQKEVEMLRQLLVVVAIFLLALSPFILLGLKDRKNGGEMADYTTATWY